MAAIGRRVVPRLVAATERRLARYFLDSRRRLEPFLLRMTLPTPTKARDAGLVDRVDVLLRSFDWDAEARILRSILRPAYAVAGDEAVAAVGSEIGSSYDLNARQVRSIEAELGRRIVAITDRSRQLVGGRIVDGIEKGLSVRDIVLGVGPGHSDGRGGVKPEFDGVRSLVDGWASTGSGARGILGPVAPAADRQARRAPPLRSTRAFLIAQTETGTAFNLSALDSYAGSGLVDFVEVFDGPECGWQTHQDPDLAHGSIRSIEDARAHALSHPRCQRAFGAALRADRAKPSPFAGREPGNVPGAAPGLRVDDTQPFSGRVVDTAPAAISDEAKAAGEELAAAVASAEPEVSALLESIRGDVGAEFEGFEFRQKASIRIAEKASTDAVMNGTTLEEGIDGINDALRYTFNLDPADYAAGVRSTVERLAEEGTELITRVDGKRGFKNFWTGDAYQGVNAVFRTRSGVRFELQFGTPDQAAAKLISHRLYEAQRLMAPGSARWLEVEREIRALWRPIHEARPSGVDGLDGWLATFLG